MAIRTMSQIKVPVAWKRADVLLASLVINLTTLALPLVILQVYDRILPNQAVNTFVLMIFFLVIAAVLEAFLRIARSSILAWHGAKYEHASTIEALDHILHADLMKFESVAIGRYLDKFDALKQIRDFYTGQSILMLVDLPFVFVFIFLIWLFASELVLIPLSVMALFAIVSFIMGKRLRVTLQERSLANERKQNFMIEILRGMHVVKSMALEAPMLRRAERLQSQSAASVHDLGRINNFIQSVGATFSQVVMMAFVAAGAVYVVHDQLTIGALAAGTMLSGRVMQPTLKAMGLWTQLQGMQVAQEKLRELFEIPSEAVSDRSGHQRLQGEIRLVGLHFRHDDAQTDLLNGIDLHVKQGEIIGITGPNGSGKSTLIELIMGFMRPTSGEILIDGKNINLMDRSSMRAQIGYLPQHGVMFEGTILENMTLFREGAAIDRALEIAQQLGLASYLMRLPQGLDTPISGASADILPAGVKQQIVFVRALVGCMHFGQPSIILFDDADSSLDLKHAKLLGKYLESMRGSHTILIITHQPGLLSICERNYVLDEGKLLHMPWLSRHKNTGAQKPDISSKPKMAS